MGLDMYLNRKTYIGGKYDDTAKWTIEFKRRDRLISIDKKKIVYIEEEQAYRRKANQIHRWFVENVQDDEDDCKQYYVPKEMLDKLVERCKKVLESLEGQILVEKERPDKRHEWQIEKYSVYPNSEIAMELLPPQEWLFFGSSDVDEYYVQDLKDTIEQLKDISDDYDYYYDSSR